MTSLQDIHKNIHADDVTLNAVIELFIVSTNYFGPSTTASQWRLENYIILRKLSYPDPMQKNDAEVKIGSGIPALVSEGEIQLAAYIQDCLNTKTRFPKI